jgi:hypothetical protein
MYHLRSVSLSVTLESVVNATQVPRPTVYAPAARESTQIQIPEWNGTKKARCDSRTLWRTGDGGACSAGAGAAQARVRPRTGVDTLFYHHTLRLSTRASHLV